MIGWFILNVLVCKPRVPLLLDYLHVGDMGAGGVTLGPSYL